MSDSPAMKDLQKLVNAYPSQAAAAKALGVDPADLTRWLRGDRELSKSVLEKLGYERKKITLHIKK